MKVPTLILITLALISIQIANGQLAKPRATIIKRDQTSSILFGIPEFQISFLNQTSTISNDPITAYQLLAGVPAIGKYADPYNFKYRLALIELNPDTASQQIDNKMIKDSIVGKNVQYYVMISGMTSSGNPRDLNMVFHPVVSPWVGQVMFNQPTQMGIFTANGIQHLEGKNVIAFTMFESQEVNPHNGGPGGIVRALSPNNARFNLEPNREVSTFWSAAYLGRNMVVTYHILLNSEGAQKIITQAIDHSPNLGELLNNLIRQKEELNNPADQSALQNATNTIAKLIAIRAPEPEAPTAPETQDREPEERPEPTQRLAEELQTLAERLQELNHALLQRR